MKIEYSSNNSGGGWWLTDQNWKDLEAAGWDVEWVANRKGSGILAADKDGRWLGALATTATVERDSLREAVEEFERVTGANASAEGCNCCGPPHNFYGTTDDGKPVYVDIDVSTSLSYSDE